LGAEIELRGLLNVAGVTSKVPLSRITPVKRLQNTDLPAITYERVSNTPVQSLKGDTSNLDQTRFRVSCWALTYAATKDIGAAVRTALGATPQVVFISDQDLYEDDTQIYRWMFDLNLWSNPK
jgi:hypothetical protein